MKTVDAIISFIALRIGYVYYHHRPVLYGGTGEGVDLLLHTYHTIWSEIMDRHEDFRKTWREVLQEEDCGSADFATRFRMSHPKASEEEIAAYVVEQWRKVSDRLAVPIDHEQLKSEFERPS